MIDVGVITGSGIYELPGEAEVLPVETRFGEAEVAVMEVGGWTIGSVARHGKGHHHLPHTIPHQANLTALEQLGARAVLATTAAGAVDPGLPLGRPILFDDLFFPANLLPNGAPCTVFTEPGDPERGHLISSEPFSPRLRERMDLAARDLGLEATVGGIYGHTNGPRFETGAEIRWLKAVGIAAVSQTCGPETVLAGELGLPYGLAGFPVNYATGVAEPESDQELRRLLTLSAGILTRLVLRTVEMLEREDLSYDHGFLYRVEGGAGDAEADLAPDGIMRGGRGVGAAVAKILVVDDEPNIREVVGLYLRRDGHAVVSAADGEEALKLFRSSDPDLVVLDLMLPRMGGLEVCRRIQAERRVPLIMLTARGEEEERIVGLSLGADDYVVKPFSPRELAARVAAVLRRVDEPVSEGADEKILAFDGLRIDPNAREVVVDDGPVTLTAREFDLLYHLASKPGRVYTRDQLMETVWGYEFAAETSTVTVHVRRLREKIEPDPAQPQYLQTVWGVGYKFGVQ